MAQIPYFWFPALLIVLAAVEWLAYLHLVPSSRNRGRVDTRSVVRRPANSA
jgi:hypothetical protein